MNPTRGQIYRCNLGYGPKPWLIISNNARNRHTADVLAARITTTSRPLPTWVPLASHDPMVGSVNTDNIETLGKDELDGYLGALTPATMAHVNQALMLALGLGS
ncbi:MAG: type II toxin-antitoxin system PemK/MazF family toxin [Mycobacterium sp.]